MPKILSRWVHLPGVHRYVPLELVIAANLELLFPGVEILGCYPFRITRNTDLEIDPDEADDLLALIQEEVRNRRFAEVVRLEVHPRMPESLRQLLIAELNADQDSDGLPLTNQDVFEVCGLLDATDLMTIAGLEIPELRDPPFLPAVPARLAGGRNIFDVIREGDVFVHHPYESFAASVERFIQTATEDPDVLAIKMTLYRTGGDSHIARLLASAAERGKQVAVLIELQARFDEENNIRWAQRFEDVGVHVSYGVAGLKTHAKVILVVRREGDQIRRYVHIGTGNYAPKTARLYTDFGLFSCDPDLGADLSDLFNVLTGFASQTGYRKLVVAPGGMRKRLGRADPPRDRACPGGTAGPDLRQDERAGGQGDHRAAVRGVARRRDRRPDRAGHLLPQAGPAGHQPADPGGERDRTVPGALPGLALRQRRGHRGLHQLGGLDAAEPGPANRGGGAARVGGASGGGAPAAGAHVDRQPPGVGYGGRRFLDPAGAGREGDRDPSDPDRAVQIRQERAELACPGRQCFSPADSANFLSSSACSSLSSWGMVTCTATIMSPRRSPLAMPSPLMRNLRPG